MYSAINDLHAWATNQKRVKPVHHARHACSLVRNYFVTKDIAWDFEIKNHESFSIMVKEARGGKIVAKI